MDRNAKSVINLYSIAIMLQLFHVGEEILGNAYFIQSFYGGSTYFLIAMLLFLCVPIVLLQYVKQNRHWAYRFSFVYAIVLIIDGIDHLIEYAVLGKYFNGAAGVYTGIGLIGIGFALAMALRKGMHKI